MAATRSRSRPTDREATEEIFHLVIDLVERLRAHFDQTMAAADLAPIQGRALRYLDEPMNMRELARRLKVDASYITSIVDGLEEQGLVERTVQPTDRRVKNLVLTPKGRQCTGELQRALFAEVPAISRLSRPKRAAFRDLLLEMLGP
jgi:MarR family transcriptional regulator, organic hydroperoxide resistance regulator